MKSALAVQHPKIDKTDGRRHPLERGGKEGPRRTVPVASNQAGHVGSIPVLVRRRGSPATKDCTYTTRESNPDHGSGWPASTPLSITATPRPRPSHPYFHAVSALIAGGAYSSAVEPTGRSAEIYTTWGLSTSWLLDGGCGYGVQTAFDYRQACFVTATLIADLLMMAFGGDIIRLNDHVHRRVGIAIF